MTDLLDFKPWGLVKYVEARTPTNSEPSAQVDDKFVNSVDGMHFTCTTATQGSQVWLGNDGLVYPPAILATDHPNLVAMYTMDNISGATLVDESPNANNGTITGAIAVAGQMGNALSFDGNDNVTTAGLPTTTNFTLSFCFKADTVSATNMIWFQNNFGGQGRGFFLGTSGLALYSRDSGGGYQQSPYMTGYDDNQWHRVVVWEDNAGLYIRVDDTTESSLAMASHRTDWLNTTYLGQVYNGSSPYTGLIDQFRRFDRTLTPEEITALYNEGAP